MSTHKCDALVVSCIDFRFQRYIHKWLDKNFKNKAFDYVGFAGATKNLQIILWQLDISVRLHKIKEVILIHHEDCGAYGKESTRKNHTRDLKKAKRSINKLYPRLMVILYYLQLNGKFEKIN